MHLPLRLLACALALALAAVSAPAALIHRYSFTDGAKDSAGHVDGKLVGADASIAGGRLVLKDNDTAYEEKVSRLEFPASVLPAGGRSVSLVVWFTARDIGGFARVLDLGTSVGTEGEQFVYFSPHIDDGASRVAITGSDVNSKTYLDFETLDDGKPHLVAIVIDGAAGKLHVYCDNREVGTAENLGANTLDKVKPAHTWLGRSSFSANPGLTGSIDEFRVYDTALTKDEAAAIFKAGPDALPRANP
jgi:hypothetical protein